MVVPEGVDDVALWRVHVELEDRPGRLGGLATAVGEAGCNIISLHVVGEPADDGAVTDELLVKVPELADPAALVDEITAAGIPCTLLVRADATELSDSATTALALARMVVADPGSAPRAVATMLRARLVAPEAPAQAHAHTLRVGTQQVRLGRAWPFTATELSRAAALLELAGQLGLASGPHPPEQSDERILLLLDGTEARLRAAGPDDSVLVAALHARCSPETRLARFGSPVPRLPPGVLQAMLAGENGGQAVLASTIDGGSAVGLVTLAPVEDGAAQLSLVVEDAWQNRGLGTSMVRRAVELAVATGAGFLIGKATGADMRLTRLLRRAGLRPTAQLVDGALLVQAPLAPAAVAG